MGPGPNFENCILICLQCSIPQWCPCKVKVGSKFANQHYGMVRGIHEDSSREWVSWILVEVFGWFRIPPWIITFLPTYLHIPFGLTNIRDWTFTSGLGGQTILGGPYFFVILFSSRLFYGVILFYHSFFRGVKLVLRSHLHILLCWLYFLGVILLIRSYLWEITAFCCF